MTEFCEHETFKDICGICHRDSRIALLTAENARLRAAMGFVRGAARLALAKASTAALNDFAVAALEAIETNADAALEVKHD